MTDRRRRAFLASAGTALATATAGCGFILGTSPAKFSASASAVADGTLQKTGYEFDARTESELKREYSAAGQTRTVVVTNVVSQYEQTIDIPLLGERRAAVFTALTTPQVKVLGKTFNPVKDMSAADLAALVQDRYEGFKNVQQQSASQVTINGSTTQQVKFSAEAVFDGAGIDIYLHISEAVPLGSDFVVSFGGYPQANSTEETNVLSMMEGIQSA